MQIDVTKEYWNGSGAPLIFLCPSIQTVGKVFSIDTGEEFTDIGFSVLASDGPAFGNLFVRMPHWRSVEFLTEEMRHRRPLIIEGKIMTERHPVSGRPWLSGTVRALGEGVPA